MLESSNTMRFEFGGEEVIREEWRWVAVYEDDSYLFQFDESTGTFHQFKEIDQSKLVVFRMVHDSLPIITVAFPKGAKLIHFYRNTMLDWGGPNQQKVKQYIFGYEDNGSKNLNVINPDSSIVLAGGTPLELTTPSL